ncbi:MAG: hypothetical protein RI897_2607 [Verrucomicrobiota bacterium]
MAGAVLPEPDGEVFVIGEAKENDGVGLVGGREPDVGGEVCAVAHGDAMGLADGVGIGGVEGVQGEAGEQCGADGGRDHVEGVSLWSGKRKAGSGKREAQSAER